MPSVFSVNLDMRGHRELGLEIDPSEKTFIKVAQVNRGVFDEWNVAHVPQLHVRPGDLIISVNGTHADPQTLINDSQVRDHLRLQIRRPQPPEPPKAQRGAADMRPDLRPDLRRPISAQHVGRRSRSSTELRRAEPLPRPQQPRGTTLQRVAA